MFISFKGCDSGLKAFNINSKKLIHIANVDDVVDIAIVPTFPKSILISENGMKLLQCDLKHLQTRANASVCLNTGMDYIDLNLAFIMENNRRKDVWRFVKVFDNTERDQEMSEPIAIAATNTQIVILRYDVENKYFKAIRSLDTATPVQSIYFTPFTAIVSSDKFFEIDLKTLISEEFLDLSDVSLAHTLGSNPLNMFAISKQEYLMCFRNFGIFVNEFGCRTRSTDLEWLKSLPKSFAYRAPILYIFHEDGIQVMHISKSKANIKEFDNDEIDHDQHVKSQSFIDAKNAQFGANWSKYGLYILSTANHVSDNAKQIVQVDGAKALQHFERFVSLESLN